MGSCEIITFKPVLCTPPAGPSNLGSTRISSQSSPKKYGSGVPFVPPSEEIHMLMADVPFPSPAPVKAPSCFWFSFFISLVFLGEKKNWALWYPIHPYFAETTYICICLSGSLCGNHLCFWDRSWYRVILSWRPWWMSSGWTPGHPCGVKGTSIPSPGAWIHTECGFLARSVQPYPGLAFFIVCIVNI